MHRLLLTGLVITVGLLVSGCGFKLRSYDLGVGIESYALVGKVRGAITSPLRQALRQAGVAEVARQEADVVIELLDQRSDRRPTSVAGQARAAEYETSLGVQFRVLDSQGVVRADAQWVERYRIYRLDRDNVVGSSEEQALVRQELEQDVVSQILRVVNAVAGPPGDPQGS